MTDWCDKDVAYKLSWNEKLVENEHIYSDILMDMGKLWTVRLIPVEFRT